MLRAERALVAAGCALAVAAAGCEPRYRIVWSPDGSAAAVIAADGLRFCDGDGRLGDVQAADIAQVRWLGGPKAPDSSKRLIVVQVEQLKTWQALRPYLPPKAAERAIADANDILRQVRAYKGDWDKFELKTAPADFLASLVYLRENHAKELAEKVGKKWEELKDVGKPLHVVRLCERTGALAARPGAVLHRELRDIAEIRPAPDGGAYAFAAKGEALFGEDPNALILFAAAAKEAAAPLRAADDVAIWFDWSLDGRELLYAVAHMEKQPQPTGTWDLRLASLVRQQVRSSDGAVLAAAKSRGNVALLARQHDRTRVRCLPDGSLLLAAIDLRLPRVQPPEAPSLWRISADGKAIRDILRADANGPPMTADLFGPGPDGALVSVPGPEGQVSVLNLRDGKLQVAQPKKEGAGQTIDTIPVWRSAKQLCFVVPPDPNAPHKRAQIVLWSTDGKVKVLSKSWPESAVKGWLTPEQKPTSQPAAK